MLNQRKTIALKIKETNEIFYNKFGNREIPGNVLKLGNIQEGEYDSPVYFPVEKGNIEEYPGNHWNPGGNRANFPLLKNGEYATMD